MHFFHSSFGVTSTIVIIEKRLDFAAKGVNLRIIGNLNKFVLLLVGDQPCRGWWVVGRARKQQR